MEQTTHKQNFIICFLMQIIVSEVSAEEAKNMRNGISISGTIKDKHEARTVNLKAGGTGKVCDMVLEDSQGGTIKLTLWNDDIDKVKTGDRVTITEAYTNTFRGETGLALPKSRGSIQVNP